MHSWFLFLSFLFLTSEAFGSSWFNAPWHQTHYQVQFNQLPLEGSVPNQHIPWSDSYWPLQRGGPAYRWKKFQDPTLDQTLSVAERTRLFFNIHLYSRKELQTLGAEKIAELSPLEKYSIFIGDEHYTLLKKFLMPTQAGRAYWQGYCDAWTMVSLHYPEPLPVRVTTSDGIVIAFGSSDIKAVLVANEVLTHEQTDDKENSRSVGAHCNRRFQYPEVKIKNGVEFFGSNPADTRGIQDRDYVQILQKFQNNALRLKYTPEDGPPPSDPHFIEYALANKNSKRCAGVDADVFHTILTNEIGLQRLGFAMDKSRDLEVWNQPVFRYRSQIIDFNPIGLNSVPGSLRSVHLKTKVFYADDTNYGWAYENPTLLNLFSTQDANLALMMKGFLLELTRYSQLLLHEGDEKEPLSYPKGIMDTVDYEYTLDLDQNDQILAGHWISFDRPDFLWIEKPSELSQAFSRLSELYHPLQIPADARPNYGQLDLQI